MDLTTLLNELTAAGGDRLAVIDERLASIERQAELLRALRRFVDPGDVAMVPAPPAAPVPETTPGKAAAGQRVGRPAGLKNQRLLSIAKAIRDQGPVTSSEAMTAAQCPTGSFWGYIQSDWFKKLPSGRYDLTSLGRSRVESLAPSSP